MGKTTLPLPFDTIQAELLTTRQITP